LSVPVDTISAFDLQRCAADFRVSGIEFMTIKRRLWEDNIMQGTKNSTQQTDTTAPSCASVMIESSCRFSRSQIAMLPDAEEEANVAVSSVPMLIS
jgi:hypothetical protein